MKTISLSILLVLALYCPQSKIQAQSTSIRINPLVGFRMHTNGLPVGIRPGGKPQMLVSPVVGFNLLFRDLPVSFSIQKDWNFEYVPHTILSEGLNYSVNQTWKQNSLLLRYDLGQKFKVLSGYYLLRIENSLNHVLGESVTRDFRGLLFGISMQFDWINLELRSKINLAPDFDALRGGALYSAMLTYQFESSRKKSKDTYSQLQLNAILGMRFFPIEGLKVLANEEFGKIGAAPTIGIEVLHKNKRLSFNLEKDIWISFNGGSSRREVKGHIASSFVGFRYHILLKNKRNIRVGLGYSLIRDLDKRAQLVVNSPYKLKGLFNYQTKGIGTTVSYEFMKNGDLELKHTFPLQSLGEPLFNPIRFSGGIIYRLDTL